MLGNHKYIYNKASPKLIKPIKQIRRGSTLIVFQELAPKTCVPKTSDQKTKKNVIILTAWLKMLQHASKITKKDFQ